MIVYTVNDGYVGNVTNLNSKNFTFLTNFREDLKVVCHM